MIKEGRKFDQGKQRWDLLDYNQINKLVEILTFGAEKYDANNWQNVEPFKERYFAAMMRHLSSFKSGEKYDPESGKSHLAHAMTNLHFLMWGEDNVWNVENLRLALDIDGVLADFNKAVSIHKNREFVKNWWKYSYIFSGKDSIWGELDGNREFWTNIEPLCSPEELPIEPVCYITARKHPEFVKEWLEKHMFACKPVISTHGSNKSKAIIDNKIDIFVDDKIDNYYELKKLGIHSFLMNQPWNERYDVGNDRIYSLSELKDKL